MKIRAAFIAFISLLLLFGTGCGPSKEDLPKLIQQLRDKDSSVRNKAALDLAGMGPDAEKATTVLIGRLRDDNGGVRSSAAFALRSIGTKRATAALDAYQK